MYPDLTPKLIVSFWARVDESDHTGCWPWMGATSPFGHGMVTLANQRWFAHRLAYVLTQGPIPVDQPVLSHICNNPGCCNPTHLKPGTQRENLAYMDACGRRPVGDDHYARKRPEVLSRGDAHYSRTKPARLARGERGGKAILTEAAVREIRRLWAEGNLTQGQIGDQFGTDQTNVSMIVYRKTWRHIE